MRGSGKRFSPGLEKGGLPASFLRAGLAVITPEVRHLAESPIQDQVKDTQATIRYIRANADRYDIDPHRIVIAGYSSGGHLAALAAMLSVEDLGGVSGEYADTSAAVSAVVDWYGPTDLTQLRSMTPADDPLSPYTHFGPDSWDDTALSPLHWVKRGLPPFFIAHGSDDLVVPPVQSRLLRDRLQAHGVPVTHIERPGGHDFSNSESVPGVITATLDFLRTVL
jgi:acetyl esterase/lipase